MMQIQGQRSKFETMFKEKTRHFLVLLLALPLGKLFSQETTNQGFKGAVAVSALFCQVDGDQASGYNKFGFSAGYLINYYFKKKFHYETGLLFTNRGSQRALNPDDPGIIPMHLSYNYVDIPISVAFPIKKLELSVGIRTLYLISAKDRQGYIIDLESNTRKIGMLGCIELRKKIGERNKITVGGMYSAFSIRNGNGTIFRNSGVFHNNLSIGFTHTL